MSALLSLEGHPRPLEHVRSAWWDTVVANWKLWVPAQLINFGLVPIHWQVLFANGVATGWSIYLSRASHGAPDGELGQQVRSGKIDES